MTGELDLAVRVAEEAGALLRDYARGGSLGVRTKSSETDPVSDADRAAERLITEALSDACPDDSIVAEEEGGQTGSSGRTWIIDPLDGTVNYLYGIPAWCVSIACEDSEGLLAAAVYDPSRNETFTAARGQGAWLNGDRIAVTEASFDRALIATGFAYDAEVRVGQGHVLAELLGVVRDVRRVGAAALDLAWTACGRFDGFYEFDLKPWDVAAGSLLVTEAGGLVSDHVITLARRDLFSVYAAGEAVHERLEEFVLARTRGPSPA